MSSQCERMNGKCRVKPHIRKNGCHDQKTGNTKCLQPFHVNNIDIFKKIQPIDTWFVFSNNYQIEGANNVVYLESLKTECKENGTELVLRVSKEFPTDEIIDEYFEETQLSVKMYEAGIGPRIYFAGISKVDGLTKVVSIQERYEDLLYAILEGIVPVHDIKTLKQQSTRLINKLISNGMIHCDIKPHNMLYRYHQNQPIVRITDFDPAFMYKTENQLDETFGMYWMMFQIDLLIYDHLNNTRDPSLYLFTPHLQKLIKTDLKRFVAWLCVHIDKDTIIISNLIHYILHANIRFVNDIYRWPPSIEKLNIGLNDNNKQLYIMCIVSALIFVAFHTETYTDYIVLKSDDPTVKEIEKSFQKLAI